MWTQGSVISLSLQCSTQGKKSDVHIPVLFKLTNMIVKTFLSSLTDFKKHSITKFCVLEREVCEVQDE